jgi:hypothetical protein
VVLGVALGDGDGLPVGAGVGVGVVCGFTVRAGVGVGNTAVAVGDTLALLLCAALPQPVHSSAATSRTISNFAFICLRLLSPKTGQGAAGLPPQPHYFCFAVITHSPLYLLHRSLAINAF